MPRTFLCRTRGGRRGRSQWSVGRGPGAGREVMCMSEQATGAHTYSAVPRARARLGPAAPPAQHQPLVGVQRKDEGRSLLLKMSS